MRRTALLEGLVGLFLGGALLTVARAAPGPRIATVGNLMRGINGPNCGALAKELKGELNDATKKSMLQHAAMLNEAGHLLMENKRCPDAVWAGACKALRDNSAIISEKVKAGDQAGAQTAFKALTSQGCGACHKAHRK